MIGPSEKSGIEIESGYQSVGHPVYCDLNPVTSLRIFVLRKIEIDVGYGPKHEEINNHKRWY